MQSEAEFFWIGLSRIPGIGRATFRKLTNRFGSPEQVLAQDRERLCSVEGLSRKAVEGIISYPWRPEAERELEEARKAGVAIVLENRDTYPAALRAIPDRPLYLYVKGSLRPSDQSAVAVVGTRKPTWYGSTMTDRVVRDLAASGITIVSGLARGIDTIAHRSALAAEGRTIAVLACGIDIPYPPENRKLLEEISEQGAVVTENPFGTKPEAGYFPARNRIISGLSLGAVIIEAAQDSGSLITASYAREQGKKLFAVPGSILSANSKGTNTLIREGAHLVENAADILRELRVEPAVKAPQPQDTADLTEDERKVLLSITGQPRHIDRLMAESNTTTAKIGSCLLTLELKGLVKQLPGKYYIKEE